MSLDTGMTILIVDDSGIMRNMLKKFLSKIGYQDFITAKDGKDAVEKLQNNVVDLIISDWNMPRMDGMELLQWVRYDDSYQDIPFIMATAQGDKTQQEAIKQEGGNGQITKPFTEAELSKKLEEVFGLTSTEEVKPIEREFVNGKVKIRATHIQITDHLALGVLKRLIDIGEIRPKYFDLDIKCMTGWNPVQEMLEKGEVDVAFVLAPIAMDLFAFDVPVRLVSLAHKNGSSLVHNITYKEYNYPSLKDFYKYKVVNIPHKMSIHHILAHKFLTELGLKPGLPEKNKPVNVRFEVVPPIQMGPIMKGRDYMGGFIVAEPIASNAIAKGIAEMECLSSSLWDDHPCCIVAMQNEFIDKYTDAAYEFTSLLVQAGKFIENNKTKAAEIAVSFLDPKKQIGLTVPILENVLHQEHGISMADLYPKLEELDEMQRYMYYQMNIGSLINVEDFVDFRFIDEATKK